MITRILNADAEALACARDLIGKGDVVAFHTETVYGLGANAFDEAAIAKIFALKGRPSDNPLIAHVHRAYNISKLIDNEPAYAAKLREAFLPGPLTMVYPSTGKVSALVSCGLNTLAIRVPSSPTAQAFLRAVDLPIAAPSANLSKHVSPVAAKHVYDDFCGRIPLILDGGACEGGIESTVLDCTGEVPVVLRAGLVTREMIASVAGACGVYEKRAGKSRKVREWRIGIIPRSAGRRIIPTRRRRSAAIGRKRARAGSRTSCAPKTPCPTGISAYWISVARRSRWRTGFTRCCGKAKTRPC